MFSSPFKVFNSSGSPRKVFLIFFCKNSLALNINSIVDSCFNSNASSILIENFPLLLVLTAAIYWIFCSHFGQLI